MTCSFKSRSDHQTKRAATDTAEERDSSTGEGVLEGTNIADDFKNEAVGSLVTQLNSMVASIGKEKQSSVGQLNYILKQAFQRTLSMNYSVIGIGCTLFSIVRSCSGAHGCRNSNPEPDRIEMIIMDEKSQKIWTAEWVEYPSKKGKSYAAIGYCNQPCSHQHRENTNQSQDAYAYDDTHQPWGNLRCKLRFASERF